MTDRANISLVCSTCGCPVELVLGVPARPNERVAVNPLADCEDAHAERSPRCHGQAVFGSGIEAGPQQYGRLRSYLARLDREAN